MRPIGAIHWIDAIGGQADHHGDDVCGGSCVDARLISGTILTVGNLRVGSFLFPPEPIEVKLLKLLSCKQEYPYGRRYVPTLITNFMMA